jgi:hypothetical protein
MVLLGLDSFDGTGSTALPLVVHSTLARAMRRAQILVSAVNEARLPVVPMPNAKWRACPVSNGQDTGPAHDHLC